MTDNEFRFFFNKWYRIAMHAAVKFLNEKESAEEIVNDAFIGLWRHIDDLPTDKRRAAYLLQTVRNKCISYRARQKPKHLPLELSHLDRQFTYCEINSLKIELIYKKVLILVDQLPKMQREVAKRYFKGMSLKQISDQFGISQKTATTHKHRAIEKIKMLIANENKL